jgi:hypothetical protein
MQGILRQTGGGRFDWLVHGERAIEGVQNDSQTPINRPLFARFNGKSLVAWDYAPQPAYDRDIRNLVIAVVRVGHPREIDHGGMGEAMRRAQKLEHFLRLSNRGAWDSVRCVPFAVHDPGESSFGASFRWSTVRPQMLEQRPDAVDSITHYHGIGGFKAGVLGEAYVGTPYAWTFTGGQRTTHHEQGHALGCPHSYSDGYAYGHPACVMAKAQCGFCGAQMRTLGQVEPVPAESGKSYFLVPIEADPDTLRSGECHALELPGNGTIVATTRKSGDQSILGAGKEGQVWIEQASGWPRVQYLRRLRPGQTIEMGGASLSHGGMREGVVRVDVGGGDDSDWPVPQSPVGDGLESASGLWHELGVEHQGLDLTVDESGLSGVLYTHAPDGDQRRWLRLQGGMDGNISVYSPDGSPTGSGQITLHGDDLRLRLYSKEFGREQFELSRLATKDQVREVKHGDAVYSYSRCGGVRVVYVRWPSGDWQIWSGLADSDLKAYEVSAPYRSSYPGDVKRIGRAEVSGDSFRLIRD